MLIGICKSVLPVAPSLSRMLDLRSHTILQVVSEGELGFVGDYKPDLQVAQVMPNLYFGEYWIPRHNFCATCTALLFTYNLSIVKIMKSVLSVYKGVLFIAYTVDITG